MVGNSGWGFSRVVGDINQREGCAGTERVDQGGEGLAMVCVQCLAWFIQYQQRRMFDQCPGQQGETLLAVRKACKWVVDLFKQVEGFQPTICGLFLLMGRAPVQPDRVEEARNGYLQTCEWRPVERRMGIKGLQFG